MILALRLRADKIGAALRQRGAAISRPKPKPEQPDAEKERVEQARREEEERERQRVAKEETDREAAEKAERERLAREADEKAKRERLAREAKENAERKKAASPPAAKPAIEKKRAPAPRLNLRGLGIAGVIFACLLLALFGGNYLVKNLTPAFTDIPGTVTKIKTPTPASTKTFTAVPPTLTPTPGIGSTVTSEKDGMVLVYVPEGEFTMGSDSGSSDEQPVHTVNLDAFWMDRTEATNAMYAQCVEDGGCDSPASVESYSRVRYYGNPEFGNYPVLYVNWNQAAAYCKWAGRELPTEAQWEKAARGPSTGPGDGRTYPWGEGIDCDKANYSSCVGDTTEVGSYADGASIYGALDMAGNVWEWVSSLYQDYPYSATDGREDLTASGSRVLRGGSWQSDGYNVRSASRSRYDPTFTYLYVGFRCSRSLP